MFVPGLVETVDNSDKNYFTMNQKGDLQLPPFAQKCLKLPTFKRDKGRTANKINKQILK